MKLIFLVIFSITSIFAQTTLCYKNWLENPNLDETRFLQGGECAGVFSSKQMQENGWKLEDSKVVKVKDNKYNHIYIFSKQDNIEKFLQNRATNLSTPTVKKEFKTKNITIFDVKSTTATINLGNLQVGQSGIVVNSRGTNPIIITQGVVTSSNKKTSKITFVQNDILKQDAIPRLKIAPLEGDNFILNHLYTTSLMIVPNSKAKKVILKNFKDQNFLNEDFFAAYLKLNDKPIPTRKTIQDFCRSHQIGTIYFVIRNKLYIVDSISFKVVDEIDVAINDSTTNSPFLTRIEKIEKAFWDFGNDKIDDYNSYYLSLIKDTNYKPKEESFEKKILNKIMEYLPW